MDRIRSFIFNKIVLKFNWCLVSRSSELIMMGFSRHNFI